MSAGRIARIAFGLLFSVFSGVCVAGGTGRAEAGRKLLADMERALAVVKKPAATICKIGAPLTGPHRAHGPKPMDFTRRITLSNGKTSYGLKYWMNVQAADGAAPLAIEGSTGLGMERPSSANWYCNNFLEFTYGGASILKTVLAEFSEEPEGSLRVRWPTEQAEVVALLSLPADGVHLQIVFHVVAKGPPKPFSIGFRAYPGHTARPWNRRVDTFHRVLCPVMRLQLPPNEHRLVLYDELDVSKTACAIDVGNAGQSGTELNLQNYGVTITLEFPAAASTETGTVRLWDLGRGSVNAAMDLVLGDEGAE
ncbi:MAG: hypothetical protein KAI66_14110 [Lentisphaeria bacterium]|nr:hypothetical protein [Lentisphaeria bacterium]